MCSPADPADFFFSGRAPRLRAGREQALIAELTGGARGAPRHFDLTLNVRGGAAGAGAHADP